MFVTPVRVHLAILAGLYLLSIAAGYQLDKYELVYSTHGWATGVGYTDANARFFAFDVLTIIAALAAALLVGGAFTRWLWPLGLAVGGWFAASIILWRHLPGVRSSASRSPQRVRPGRASTSRNNIAMTRLAFGLDDWETRGYRGDAPLTTEAIAERGGHVPERPAVGLPPARRHARPAPDRAPVLRLRRRRHRPLHRSTASTRQVMLSARELAQERNPQRDELGQRAAHLHPRHRRSPWSR